MHKCGRIARRKAAVRYVCCSPVVSAPRGLRMPATKKAAKKAVRKPAKRAARKAPASRRLSAAHKRALAEGRTMSATVDRYLSAVNTPKRRGRKVSKSALQQRLVDARA